MLKLRNKFHLFHNVYFFRSLFMLDWIEFASGHTKISHHASLTFQFTIYIYILTSRKTELEREREISLFGIMIKMDWKKKSFSSSTNTLKMKQYCID